MGRGWPALRRFSVRFDEYNKMLRIFVDQQRNLNKLERPILRCAKILWQRVIDEGYSLPGGFDQLEGIFRMSEESCFLWRDPFKEYYSTLQSQQLEACSVLQIVEYVRINALKWAIEQVADSLNQLNRLSENHIQGMAQAIEMIKCQA